MIDWSAVRIEEEHVAALRLLAREPESWPSLQEKMPTDQAAAGYMQVIYAGCALALRRRFSPTYTVHDVVRYVAELRIELKEAGGDDFNPRIAEQVIRGILGDPSVQRLQATDDRMAVEDLQHSMVPQMNALFSVIGDGRSTDAETERFIQEAAGLARRWVEQKQAAASTG